MDGTPTEVVKHHQVGITAIVSISSITAAYKSAIVPISRHGFVVPSNEAKHYLILHMDKQALVNLEVGIRSHAKIMAIGIAIQNFPEGAIISLPAAASGVSRGKSFFLGIVSALAESAGAVLALALSSIFLPALPYLLGFAAGAMIYVVVSELIPEAALGAKTRHATIAFSAGFLLMMALDVALG